MPRRLIVFVVRCGRGIRWLSCLSISFFLLWSYLNRSSDYLLMLLSIFDGMSLSGCFTVVRPGFVEFVPPAKSMAKVYASSMRSGRLSSRPFCCGGAGWKSERVCLVGREWRARIFERSRARTNASLARSARAELRLTPITV